MNTLALKYRPRMLSDLVGQEASVRALANALRRAKQSGAIHHQAFLFAGVRGTGKTSTARILARSLNCVHGPTPEPCGVCDPCRASERPDQSLDIIEIDAASRASVEDARALREQIQTRPAFCRYRVYIIDEVHMMSRSAFDALLKILEEPPSHAVFVLATTELQDVPDTIKSRVQIYPFRLIPPSLIEQRLVDVCRQENVAWDEGALRLLAEAGQGSMRDALTTLDRVIAAGDGRVEEAQVREQLGIVPAIRVQGMLEALLAGETAAILDHCRALSDLGTDWTSFWRELMLAFRDRLEAEVRREPAPQELLRMARMLQVLLQRERDLRDSSLPEVVVELALLTAAQLPHLAPLDALLKGLPSAPAAQSRPHSRPAAPPLPMEAPEPVSARGAQPPPLRSAPEPPSAAPEPRDPIPVDPAHLESLRQACTEALKGAAELPRSLAALPHLAAELRWDSPVLHWSFPAGVRNTVQDLEREQLNPALLAALRRVFPALRAIAITFEAAVRPRPEDQLKEDPAFQALLESTQGEILEVRRDKA